MLPTRLLSNRRHCLPFRNNYIKLFSGSVNEAEISKFSRIGSGWWDSNDVGGSGPLHAMNPTRVNFIRENVACQMNRNDWFVGEQLKGLKILDVGCGGGILSESLARLGAHVTGIDPSFENINIATNHSKLNPSTSTINYQKSTIEEIVESGQLFDVVCALEVVEHVDNVNEFIKNCTKCVKNDGHLFISTINRTAKSYLLTILGAEYITGIIPI
eukprot:gene12084-16170_t